MVSASSNQSSIGLIQKFFFPGSSNMIQYNDSNEDCNRFWSKYIMQTYFLFIAIICYTTFQTFFTYNNTTVRLFMFSTTVVTGLILTKVSIAASRLTNEVSSRID